MTRALRAECLLTLRILFRQPAFWVPTALFPAMLYLFFGAESGGGRWAANAMASFSVYAALGVGFFLFGVSIAQDRVSPFASWARSLPGSFSDQWIARTLAALIFVAIAVTLVIAAALSLTDVELGAAAWLRLGVVCLFSVIAATLMGIALGSLVSANASVAVANLIYLPLAYFGGLWVPPFAMPETIAAVSEWTPTRAMGELSWAAVEGRAWEVEHLLLLLTWSAAAGALAAFAQRRGRAA